MSTNQQLKTTYPGQAGSNCIVNCDCLFVISHALYLNKNIKLGRFKGMLTKLGRLKGLLTNLG